MVRFLGYGVPRSETLIAEHDNAEQASGQYARACGALTRVRRACLWRVQRACATPPPQGGAKARSSARGQRDVVVFLTSYAASVFIDTDKVHSSPLGAHCLGSRTLYRPLTIRNLVMCVVLCFVDPILGKSQSRCHFLNQGTWGGWILTLHLNYLTGYTGLLLFLFERTHNYSVDNQGLVS